MTPEEDLVGLMAVNRDVIGQAETFDRSDRIVLDMDSSESPVHGQQEGGAYNGHFETVCYHPLFLINNHGDCLAVKLRSGNVHSADAAFAKPELYDALEVGGASTIVWQLDHARQTESPDAGSRSRRKRREIPQAGALTI